MKRNAVRIGSAIGPASNKLLPLLYATTTLGLNGASPEKLRGPNDYLGGRLSLSAMRTSSINEPACIFSMT
jgi:hypothetical protein